MPVVATGPRREQLKAVLETRDQAVEPEGATARGRQLDRQRHATERAAEHADAAHVE
ncbi:MAG TPA: hypothetical protein VLJ62_24795 [Burkholderiaceae bacterium]|nr:hypothetical protein [Burkholderiaceae bacterium]